MKCEYCQEFIPEGKKFCGHCGKPVKKIPAEDFKTLKHPPQKIKEKRELPEEKSRLIAKKTQGEKQEMKGRKRKTIYWILAAVIVTIFLVVAFIPQDHIFAIGWHDYDDNNILSQQEPISENRSFTRFFHTYSTYFRWNTKTESQAIDFRDKTNIRISVNGEVLDFDEHCRIEDYYIPGTDTHHC